MPGEGTIGSCQAPGLLVRCPAHDGAGSLRELLLLRLPRAGTGPAPGGVAPLLPPPPLHPPPPLRRFNFSRPGGIPGLGVRGLRAAPPPTEDTGRPMSKP